VPPFPGQYEPPHQADADSSQSDTAGLQRSSCGTDVIHKQDAASLQATVSAVEGSLYILSSLEGVQAHLRDGALDPDKGIVHQGNVKRLVYLVGHEGRLIIAPLFEALAMKRHRDDDVCGQVILRQVFACELA